MATVVLLGTLDTKEREYLFVRELLLAAGVTPILVDFGVLADPLILADISAREVAEAGGKQLEELRLATEVAGNRAHSLGVMITGLTVILNKLRKEQRCDGVFGMGGSGGTNAISTAMRSLPLGVPKLIVSTMASGNVGGYIGTKDIAILYSVTDSSDRFIECYGGNTTCSTTSSNPSNESDELNSCLSHLLGLLSSKTPTQGQTSLLYSDP